MKALAWSIFLSTATACIWLGPEIPKDSQSAVGGALVIGFVILCVLLVIEE